MPDISMCENNACPLANRCYRHEATPTPLWQVYAAFEPDEQGHCPNWWPMEDKSMSATTENNRKETQ